MDGVDGAMVLTDGISVFEFGATGYRPYSSAEKDVIAAAQGRWPGEDGVADATRVIERAHKDLIARFGGVALIGFHGQTLAHAPGTRGTHQAGDGDQLARDTGIPVVWDFRKADVDAGGQGAPLAPFYHFALARRFSTGPVAFLNLGGVGNVTFVNPLAQSPDAPGAVLAFDTGPANALMDDFARSRTGLACDYGGALAGLGQVDAAILAAFMEHPFFSQTPPKSLDRNTFGDLVTSVAGLSDSDGLATLAAATVASVDAAFRFAPRKAEKVLVAGGGRKNAHLMQTLSHRLDPPVTSVDENGMDGDMLEAQAFAYLAVRAKNGFTLSAPGSTGVPQALSGGRLSPP